MTYTVINSGFERYVDDILDALERYAEEYSEDCSLPELVDDITSGRFELWLICDSATEAFVAFMTARYDEQQKRFILYDLCGTGGLNLVECLKFAESVACSRGAKNISIFGRMGWNRKLRGRGYRTHVVEYRKGLCHGEKQARDNEAGTEAGRSATSLDVTAL